MEKIIADNPQEVIWLRLSRLKSIKISKKIISKKINDSTAQISQDLLHKKAVGVSSAIDSALGFWNSKADDLNSKVLSRYYALLHMTIAEQVASINNEDDLARIQRHTEYGHGLATIRDVEGEFPDNYYVYIMQSGHFNSYLKYLGFDVKKVQFEKRIKDFNKMNDENILNVVSISELFRRLPELQPVIKEYLDKDPLAFQVVNSDTFESMMSGRTEDELEYKKTLVSIIPEEKDTSLAYIQSLNLPLENIIEEKSNDKNVFKGIVTHQKDIHWQTKLKTYKSSHSGTSIIQPVFNDINDVIVIHFMILYALSIIVRYLPDLWYKITNEELDDMYSLIEYYLSIFDNVIPLKMLERITGDKLNVEQPGSLFGRI